MDVASEWDNVSKLGMLYYVDENNMLISMNVSSSNALKIRIEAQLKYILKCIKNMTRRCFEVF